MPWKSGKRLLCAAAGVLVGLNVGQIPVGAEALTEAGVADHSQVIELERPVGEEAFVYAINNNDVVAGAVLGNVWRAATWDRNGKIRLLAEVPGGSPTGAITELPSVGSGINEAWAINRHGVIAGTVQENFPSTPILPGRWDRQGRLTELSVPAGAVTSSASYISDNGSVAGELGFATQMRAARWNPAGTTLSWRRYRVTGAPSSCR